jgi:hypothetical protein
MANHKTISREGSKVVCILVGVTKVFLIHVVLGETDSERVKNHILIGEFNFIRLLSELQSFLDIKLLFINHL